MITTIGNDAEGERGTKEAPYTCFICMEPCEPSPRQVCLCKTLLCHPSCQLQMMRQMESVECTVCKTPFRNASVRQRRVLSQTGWSGMCIFSFIIMLASSTFCMYLAFGMPHILLIETVCFLFVAFSFLVILLRNPISYSTLNKVHMTAEWRVMATAP